MGGWEKTIRLWQKRFWHKPACVECPFMTPVLVVAARSVVPLGTEMAACRPIRRRVRRKVGVGVGLPRHHRKVERSIPLDNTILDSASVATHPTLRRMSQNEDATMVLHV